MDAMELEVARHAIRSGKERETAQRLQAAHGKKFDSRTLAQSRKDVAGLLGEVVAPVSIRETLRQSVEQIDNQRHTNRRTHER